MFFSVLIAAICVGTGLAMDIPIGETQKGSFGFLQMEGMSACGKKVDSSTDQFVSISHKWWTAANANDDPLCEMCVDVTWQGKNLKLPIRERCPSDDPKYMDLSESAFKHFADLSVIKCTDVDWKFVKC
ncbi:papain inhibitor [Ditylenchus destructor]|nr:papain inhibitor [Ditylenchus destructor]